MSLFQRPLQPPSVLSDEAVERYLAAVRAELSVDPLFRRRLRGAVVNRFVAEREGRAVPRTRRRMGGLGRAVLYATFALSVSVSSAMAASQGAAPGDPLYPLKLQIERLRLHALPEHLHDDLAAHSLGERIHELGMLAERGDWARVASQVAAVEGEYRHFLDATSLGGSSDQFVLVLTELLERLPDRAQLAIADVLDGVEAATHADTPDDGSGRAAGSGSTSDRRGAGGGKGAAPVASEPAIAEPTPEPARTERPEPTPRASRSPRPSTERPAPSASESDAADGTDADTADD